MKKIIILFVLLNFQSVFAEIRIYPIYREKKHDSNNKTGRLYDLKIIIKNTGASDLRVATKDIQDNGTLSLPFHRIVKSGEKAHTETGIKIGDLRSGWFFEEGLPFVPSESDFRIVRLRSGECAIIRAELNITTNDEPDDVLFKYEIGKMVGDRFSVWCGVVESRLIKDDRSGLDMILRRSDEQTKAAKPKADQ